MEKQQGKIPEIRFPEFNAELERKRLGKIIYKTDRKNKENLDLPVYSINNTEGFLPQAEQFEGRNSHDRGFDISLYKIINKNTFAYNPARINVGSIGYSYELDNILVSSLYVCFKTKETIDDTYLLQFLKTFSFKTSILRFEEGGVRKYLFFDNISKIPILLPSISEQKRIASFRSVTDKRLTQLKEKKALLEIYKKGMMQKIFSQELRFKDENGKEFPNWENKKLGDLGKIIGGGTPDSNNKGYWQGSIPWISSSDILENNINKILITRYISEKALKESATKLIPKNSILIVSRVGIGKFAIASQDICTSQDFSNFIPNNINSTFLAYYFSTQSYRFISLGQGTSIKGFTGADMRNLKFKISYSEEEQTKIANFLSGIDHKINICQSKIEQTQGYKKSLLQKMFV
jgi:type I restriction enzyme S subunit